MLAVKNYEKQARFVLFLTKVSTLYRLASTSKYTCDPLRDLVPFAQFKKREKHPWKSATFSKVVSWKPATLLKVTLLHRSFPRFLSFASGTKSCNTSHMTFRWTSGVKDFNLLTQTLNGIFGCMGWLWTYLIENNTSETSVDLGIEWVN